MIKKILIGIVLIFVVVIIIGVAVGGGSNNETKKVGNTTTTETNNATSNQQTQATTIPTKIYKIGDLVDLQGKTVAVNAVAPYTSNNQFLTPKSGNKFVMVDITLKNNSKDPYSYNPLEFKLQDNQDYGYSMTTSDKEPALHADALQPGLTTRGFITFEIPEANIPAKLIYTPGFWNLSQIVIDLTQ